MGGKTRQNAEETKGGCREDKNDCAEDVRQKDARIERIEGKALDALSKYLKSEKDPDPTEEETAKDEEP